MRSEASSTTRHYTTCLKKNQKKLELMTLSIVLVLDPTKVCFQHYFLLPGINVALELTGEKSVANVQSV